MSKHVLTRVGVLILALGLLYGGLDTADAAVSGPAGNGGTDGEGGRG